MQIVSEPRRGSLKLRMDPEMNARRMTLDRFCFGAVIACTMWAVGCDSNPAYQPPAASVNGSAPSAASALPLEATGDVAGEADVPAGQWRPAADSQEAIVISEPAAVQEPIAEAPLANAPVADDPPATTAETEIKDDSEKAHAGGESSLKFASAQPEYFVGWPKPRLALVISGRQDGYLEPCGCAGLENQKGGLNRRHAFFKQLKERGWPVAAVDVGGQVRRFGRQAEVQYTLVADALKQMGYSAVAFGADDLRLSAGHLLSSVVAEKPEDSIFVAANVSLFDMTPKAKIIEAGGMKIGVTSILGKTFGEQVHNDEIVVQTAEEALRAVLPELQDCDVRVLLAHATKEECVELARKFPEFSLVVTAEDIDEPKAQPDTIEGTKTKLIEVGHKGMYVVVAGFFDDPHEPVRFQRVALDSRFPDTAEMKQLMVTYQDQLQQLGWDGLGIRSMPHPRSRQAGELGGTFVGSAKCKDCHQEAYDVWANSKHAHATDTLAHLTPPRQFDAECVSCHVVGWSPQDYFPYTTGYESLDKTPHLVGNGCENCHGPGGAHVAAEEGEDVGGDAETLRKQMHLTWNAAKTDMCVKCHDLDNSPEFSGNVDRYWSEIAH
jgi:hypothetical protein